jgi:hypothetical protein
MYLKKYDWSEERLPDKEALELCGKIVIGEGIESVSDCRIARKTRAIDFQGDNWSISIYDTGRVYLLRNSMGGCHNNNPIIDNLLLETQWIDPKVELPKDAETDDDNINYVIKLKNGIMKAEYHSPIFYVYDKNDNETLYNKNEIIGWLSAENVVM